MKFTALYTFLILLASPSLSWEGNEGFGQCAATLRAGGPCGPGRAGCPYILSLPPMTVHLPEQFGVLENLMKDLQTLKDDVDQLRKMCGDCGRRQESRYGDEGRSETQCLEQGDLEDGDEQGKTVARSMSAVETSEKEVKEAAGNNGKGQSERPEEESGKQFGNNQMQVRPDETNGTDKKTQIKMPQDRGRQDQRKIWEEKKKEMEKGVKAGQRIEKPKQTANKELADKSESIKKYVEKVVEKEDGETRSVKTERGKAGENVQRHSDGDSAPSKATQRTDYVSISPTPVLTFSSAQRPALVDLDKTERITSSLPSPPFSGSTSNYLPVINPRRTQTASTESITMRYPLDVTRSPSSSSTSIIPPHNLRTTISPKATERSRWPSTDIGSKHQPGLKDEAEVKRTPGIKPDAIKPKDSKHDRKLDMKTKQKTAQQKIRPGMKLKSGNDTRRFHIQRADKRTTDPYLKPPKAKHGQVMTTNLQQVATDQQARPATDEVPESDQTLMLNKNSEPNKRPVHPVKSSMTDQKQKTDKNLKTDTKEKLDKNEAKLHLLPDLQTDSKKRQKLIQPVNSDSSGDSESQNNFTANPNHKLKSSQIIPNINAKPKTVEVPKLNQKQLKPARDQNNQDNMKPKASQALPDPEHQSVSNQNPGEDSKRKSESWSRSADTPPTSLMLKPGRPPSEPNQKTTTPQPRHFHRATTASFDDQHPPKPTPDVQMPEVTHSRMDTEFKPSTMKTVTQKTFGSPRLRGPNSGVVFKPTPQTTSSPSSIPKSTQTILLGSVIPSTNPDLTKPNLHARDEAATRQKTLEPLSPRAQNSSSSDLSSTTTTDPVAQPAAELSTSSARELRVKIKQLAATFFNGSRLGPNRRSPPGKPLKDLPEDHQGDNRPVSGSLMQIPSGGAVSVVKKDCSDHLVKGQVMKSGIYQVIPDLHTGNGVPVLCDMEVQGGGWTVLQLRQDGNVSFNRTWAEYRSGFGELLNGGEFWLGNQYIHFLTRNRDMTLRVELKDFSGMTGYAEYENFRVASERMRYRLTVEGYSGTAGNALRFSPQYDHNNQAFTTPDRDNDRYPAGNCGAYYSSGWWFDACMAANLNGRYYLGKYKGVRNGIYWGAWQNISTEFYLTSERQSFKTVRMMIRPKGFLKS
ncbi:serine/arginine repetitive matrix protein 1-like [Hippocampus zosterae]|uniref:serine/arginine repetitive matrix protein 1-like n=1 Tax=Hippocampus zosterae TaxID=109293 RepID=UPI00223E84F9|nr:serine/arginine repetitive matrix protein 1-like [Hippocampus zosterae]